MPSVDFETTDRTDLYWDMEGNTDEWCGSPDFHEPVMSEDISHSSLV